LELINNHEERYKNSSLLTKEYGGVIENWTGKKMKEDHQVYEIKESNNSF
jgi:hypothetical protein